MARIYGRVRLAGQVIWASRIKETVSESPVQSGKGGGPTQRNYSYSICFAIGLCEGEILGVDRLWANGAPLQQRGLVSRVHLGTENQLPDPIISAIEGSDVPSFRGTAYIVFEDFPLDDYGARLPQINAKVIRVPPSQQDTPRLETMIRGVNLLPASGEFAYATEVVEETPSPTSARPINMNNLSGQADIEQALDQLETQLPNVKNVSIITAWFGTDLRCGSCEIKPGVETISRITPDATWRVSGVTRGTAYLVSQSVDGRPNYGGTPSDASILQAITSLKSRGFKVTLYPFILMDIPESNGLPDPYGGTEQEAFPWRGRTTCFPQSAENTAAVAGQVDSFFGTANKVDFGVQNGVPNYSGPDAFTYRRFILHYAKLAQISAGVDRFAIGTEMVGLTTLRGAGDTYPAVQKLVDLAADVRAMLPVQTQITYAADWTEYFGHHPQDGNGDVTFHLDPLWASPDIDAVGIDAYFPLSDWRDRDEHLDKALADDCYDLSYLKSQMEGGEGYDYYYASRSDRDAQTRTPITDGAVGKPWVFRNKDLRSWWSEPHYNRRNGAELNTPTAWIPQSKPIWLMEIGCPAIDKGANQPNVFYDAKSAQSQIPYYSDGARDDLIQRRYLEVFISYWSEASGNNPHSAIYNGPMIETDMVNVWAWDARPFPDFPARDTVWSDGENWQRGHWLSGRMGLVPLADMVEDICTESNIDNIDVTKLSGLVQGYRIDRPMTGRAALTPLSLAYDFDLKETAEGLRFMSYGHASPIELSPEAIAGDLSASIEDIKASPEDRLRDARLHFIDAGNDYELGLASARDRAAETVRILDVNAPIVMDRSFARLTAECLLARQLASDRRLNFQLSSANLHVEVGDIIKLPTLDELWQVETLEGLTTQRVQARLLGERVAPPNHGGIPSVSTSPQWAAKPSLFAIDIPGQYDGPLVGVGLDPFFTAEIVAPEESVTVTSPARIGALLSDLPRGPIGRWDKANVIEALLPNALLSSLQETELLAGGNKFAVETETGWEVLQAANAELIAPLTYRLSHLLRGQDGSDAQSVPLIPAGARFIWLGAGWQDLPLPDSAVGETVAMMATAAGRESDVLEHLYKAAHLRPLSPVHVKFRETDDETQLSWIRRTRIGGDNWTGLDVPLGEEVEHYRIQLWSGDTLIEEHETTEPKLILPSLRNADRVIIAQASRAYGWGAEVTHSL
uniref:baseplate multidomain protein megatron n=1 Tax=Hellea balneolensis TaxID=287478 RepID=UPI00041FACA6|nr:glycoside hydrolase/phage tail family protein [Hellea balneolensis]